MDRLRVEPRSEQARCPYCHEVVAPADEKAPCLACMAWHHRACRDEHGSCAACGATEGAERRRVPPPAPAPVAPEVVREQRPPWLPPEDGWLQRQAAEPPPVWRAEQERAAAPGPPPTPIGARALLYYALVLLALGILVRVLGG